jgi:HlyD family secretion protein
VEGTEVSLSAKVRGEVIKLDVEEGSEVNKGELVAQINSDQIQSQIANAEAQIAETDAMLIRSHNRVEILESRLQGAKIALELSSTQSKAKIERAEAALASAKAVLNQAETNFAKAEKDYLRFSPLAKEKTISQSMMDGVDEAHQVTKAEVERATRGVLLAEASLNLAKSSATEIRLRENDMETLEKELIAAKTDENIAKAGVDAAKARKSEIEATLSDTYVYSPVEGTVTDKVIELGENVVPGTPIVVITDMKQLYVKTYVEQSRIGNVKLNDPCRIYCDSFPDRYFEGHVTFVAPRAEFTPRDVQMNEHRTSMVYKIKVGIANPELILKPGMPADMDLKWKNDQSWD